MRKHKFFSEIKPVVDAVLTVIAILFLCAVAVIMTGCASTELAQRPSIPYTYPTYAMPHGSEFAKPYELELPVGEVFDEVEPILIEDRVEPTVTP